MAQNNNSGGNSRYNKDNSLYVPTSGGRNNPKQIHVAHRRSQSELTNLMIEQFTLQRQLEMVQAQQQHLLQQQQQLAQQANQIMNNGNNNNNSGGARSRSHSRNNSAYYNNNNNSNNNNNNNIAGVPSINVQDSSSYAHKRTGSQSSVYGHSRRHSLGLNEAKRAAAEEQAKRSANEHTSNPNDSTEPNSSFKFPASNEPKDFTSPSKNGSPSFKFPSTNYNNTNNDDFIATPTQQHRRNKSKNMVESLSGIHSNWRNQSQQQTSSQPSPFRHRQSTSKDVSSYNTLEPPAFFQSGHKHRQSNSSVHSFNFSNSNTPISGNNNSNQRKSLFAPYLPQANIPELIQEGRLVAGILRVNKKNRSDAWVSTDGILDSDIYICGSKDRNRALEGDLVAVELLVVDDVWESKKEKEEKKRRKDASNQHDAIPLNDNDDYHNDASSHIRTSSNLHVQSSQDENLLRSPVTPHNPSHILTSPSSTITNPDNEDYSPTRSGLKRKGSLKQRPTQKKNDDVEVEGQSLLLVEEEEINDDFKPLYAGHVVAVLDRIPGQLFSGTLGLLRPSQQAQNDHSNNKGPQNPKIVWFKPTDKKVPLIAIPTEFAPKDFVECADKYADKLFVASIKRWPITSLHPFGVLVAELGEINDSDVEIDSILRDSNFLSNEYLDSKDPTKERAVFEALKIPSEKLAKRTQFTDKDTYNIIAISSNNGLSDFAFHIINNDDGTIDFACHVVDATEQIEENSSLDRRARKRSSAVFMPQRIVDLLPQALNDSLTLKADKESATISVVYKLDSQSLKTKSVRVEESIITPSSVKSIDDITDSLANKAPDEYLIRLKEIATKFYRDRLGSSDLDLLPSLALIDSIDDEKTKVDLNILDRSLGAIIFNEVERKVNSTVAEKIYSKLGDLTFLRRHPQPVANKTLTFLKKVEKLGYQIDTSSVDKLLQSVLAIKDSDVRTGVQILLFKTMCRAKYFIAGKGDPDQYGHYIFNLPLYTHFTAPLRRYADHVVHRQLKAVLNGLPYKEDMESLKITAEYCNFKKDCAYQAQEQAVHLLLCKTINDMGNTTGQLLTMATVLQVYESSFDVFFPEFGVEKRVHGDQLPLIKAEFDEVNRSLELHWQPGVDSATFIPPDEKNPKSYRNSIKNKFKSTTKEIAVTEFEKEASGKTSVSENLASELAKMSLDIPKLRLPPSGSDGNSSLNDFIATTTTRVENDNYIQEIRELQKIPILLRAEIGMALPCLSVRAINPFMNS